MAGNIGTRTAAVALLAFLLGGPVASEELTLNQAIEQALSSNPTIAAGQMSANAAAEAARGAKALTNPELTVAPSVVGTAGADSAALISQPLEINGSRKARSRIAGQEAVAAVADAQVISRDIILRVKQLYWSTARAQQLVGLNQDNVTYLDTLGKAVRRQVEVGRTPGSQAIKTDVELARAKQELAQAQLDLDSTKAALGRLMNRSGKPEFTLADELSFSSPTLDGDKLMAAGLARRPEVLSATAQVGVAEGQVSAARASRTPDVAIQARKESFDSGEGGVALAFTLPVFDWGSAKASIRQARLVTSSKQKQLEAQKSAVSLDIEQAMLAVRTAAEVVREYQGGILDKSVQLAAMAQKGYEKGATSYLEVLEAQRTLRSVRTEYISALADHAKAVAQLEWAANVDLGGAEVKK